MIVSVGISDEEGSGGGEDGKSTLMSEVGLTIKDGRRISFFFIGSSGKSILSCCVSFCS